MPPEHVMAMILKSADTSMRMHYQPSAMPMGIWIMREGQVAAEEFVAFVREGVSFARQKALRRLAGRAGYPTHPAHIAMAHVYIVMAYIVMAYAVMAYVVMACIVIWPEATRREDGVPNPSTFGIAVITTWARSTEAITT